MSLRYEESVVAPARKGRTRGLRVRFPSRFGEGNERGENTHRLALTTASVEVIDLERPKDICGHMLHM